MKSAYSYPRSRRLGGTEKFSAVFETKVRQSRGPLAVYSRPNELGHPRFGLSVPRAVGTAVRRNRIKRLLREAFRLMQRDLPAGYDLVVVVRPHEPLILADYQKLLSGLCIRLHQHWTRRNDTGNE